MFRTETVTLCHISYFDHEGYEGDNKFSKNLVKVMDFIRILPISQQEIFCLTNYFFPLIIYLPKVGGKKWVQ